MSLEKIILDALTDFIHSHIANADLSAMDEVFFSYVTGVLEELGSQGSSEEDFDMETFMEMLEGYIPGFAEIGSEKVYEIMFELSGRLSKARNKDNCSDETSETSLITESGEIERKGNRLHVASEGAEAQEKGNAKNVDVLLEMFPSCTLHQAEIALSMAKGNLEDAVQIIVEGEVTLDSSEPEEKGNAKNVDVLLEMFPSCTLHQAEIALSLAKGKLEDAVQIIVEGEVTLDPSEPEVFQKIPKKEDLKEFILQKYMLVDDEDDKKTHKPLMPKEAPKKMIRYIDNQVVSTKGERYKDIKKPESEDMKKTYINLKPARKYKFH